MFLRASGVLALLAFSVCAATDPKEVFEAAARALSSGDLTAAEQGFQQVLRTQPGHIGALGNLGVVYARLGRHAEAASVYRKALKLAPQDPLLHLNLGLAYLRQEEYAAAKPHLETVLRVQPANAQARQLLATARIFTGEADKAIPVLEAEPARDAVSMYLLAVAYLKQGRREEAGKQFQEMLRSLPPAQAHFLSGRALYESELFTEALAELEKARDLDPGLSGLWRELGKACVSLRRTDAARDAFRQALQQTPADQESQYFLGALLVQEGDVDAGVAWLEKARAARPEFWGSYYYLGKAALSAGKADRAIALLRRAVDLNPGEATAWYQLSRALKSAGRNAEASEASRRYTSLRSQARAEGEAVVLK